MKKNTIKICAATPNVSIGNVSKNMETILLETERASLRGVDLILFPELSLTGATAGDTFFRDDLLRKAEEAAQTIADASDACSVVTAIGYPLKSGAELYDAVKLSDGDSAYFFSKSSLSGRGFYDQTRWFQSGDVKKQIVETISGVKITVVPFEDLFAVDRRSIQGAEVVLSPSAVPKTQGMTDLIKERIVAASEEFNAAVVFCNAGLGESVTDRLFDGGAIIASCGKVLSESFQSGERFAEAEVDLGEIREKRKNNVASDTDLGGSEIETEESEDTEPFRKFPFVATNIVAQATEIFSIQAEALKRRILHVGANKAVLGVSGGLDSTLALLVSVEAMKRAGKTSKDVLAVTMPGIGTSGRTYENAKRLMELLNVDRREISIAKAFRGHLEDLNHSGEADVAYENAQARERTQILMDLANMERGIVVGTGDLSELATGFATYNGDHMSMYGVNGSVPKTLMREMVKVLARNAGGELETVLNDVVETPVSPELKPSVGGETSQFTESVLGPYELIDFFLYYFHFKGLGAEELHRAAAETFGDRYSEAELVKLQNGFVRRFYASQFKRSCMPDGIDATGYSFSPRGALALPSDMSAEPFLLSETIGSAGS